MSGEHMHRFKFASSGMVHLHRNEDSPEGRKTEGKRIFYLTKSIGND